MTNVNRIKKKKQKTKGSKYFLIQLYLYFLNSHNHNSTLLLFFALANCSLLSWQLISSLFLYFWCWNVCFKSSFLVCQPCKKKYLVLWNEDYWTTFVYLEHRTYTSDFSSLGVALKSALCSLSEFIIWNQRLSQLCV